MLLPIRPMLSARGAGMKVHTRHPFCATLALGFSLLASSTLYSRADETFVCADGSSITIDDANRAAMRDHPCIKTWFANDLAGRQAQAEQGAGGSGAGVQPVVHRYTVHRAVALRDLRNRPAYLAWSRARTVQVRSYARTNETVVGAHVRSPPSQRRGVTIRVPAGRR